MGIEPSSRLPVFIVISCLGIMFIYNGFTAMSTGYTPTRYGSGFVKNTSGGLVELLLGTAIVIGGVVWLARGDED